MSTIFEQLITLTKFYSIFMKKSLSLKISSIFIFVVIVSGCQKDNVKGIRLNVNAKDAQNTYFDWETATTMPVSPSSPAVPMPWQSQSGSYIDPALLTDYSHSDGWDLIYNTFNNTAIATEYGQPAGGLYFALYNRYRGLLRFYLYIPPGLFGNSSDIEHGLSVYSDKNGIASKMLNFDGADIVDPTVSTPSFVKTTNTGVAVAGGWYAMQYEIAYDPAFSPTVYPDLGFTWNSKTLNISSISLDGTDVGTLSGNITQSSSTGFSLTGVVKGVGEIVSTVKKSNDTSSFTNTLINVAKNGLAGNISGVLSAIFGGSHTNSQAVDLKMNSTISLTGSLTGSQIVANNSLVFPGQNTANTIGAPTPLKSYPLGLFNLSGRPTIYVHTTSQPVTINENGQNVQYNLYSVQYTVSAQDIYNNLFETNGAIINTGTDGATIPFSSFNAQVVMINPSTQYNFSAIANHETIGDLNVYTGLPVTLQYLAEHGLPVINNQAAVRLIFKVVPNNGAPASTIVKTFTANLVNN